MEYISITRYQRGSMAEKKKEERTRGVEVGLMTGTLQEEGKARLILPLNDCESKGSVA